MRVIPACLAFAALMNVGLAAERVVEFDSGEKAYPGDLAAMDGETFKQGACLIAGEHDLSRMRGSRSRSMRMAASV